MNKILLIALVAAISCYDLTDFNNKEIIAHNAKRALHQNTPSLTFNETLRQHAQSWAETICLRNSDPSNKSLSWGHSGTSGMGENMHAGWGPNVKPGDATDNWYNEIDNYDFSISYAKSGKTFGDIGHFTQLVWSSSLTAGFGISSCANGWTVVVGNY